MLIFVLQMERYLLRNHETRKYVQEQAYRLQQGIVTTTTQQASALGGGRCRCQILSTSILWVPHTVQR